MMMIQQYSFALVECNLFLDSHPNNRDALEYFEEVKRMLAEYTEAYEENYGPLTVFGSDEKSFDWVNTPWPWEMSE